MKSSFLFLFVFFLGVLDPKSFFMGVLCLLGVLETDLSRNRPVLKGFVPTDIEVSDEPYSIGPLKNGLLPILIDEIDDLGVDEEPLEK